MEYRIDYEFALKLIMFGKNIDCNREFYTESEVRRILAIAFNALPSNELPSWNKVLDNFKAYENYYYESQDCCAYYRIMGKAQSHGNDDAVDDGNCYYRPSFIEHYIYSDKKLSIEEIAHNNCMEACYEKFYKQGKEDYI